MLAANFSKARRKNNPIATSGLLVILTVPGEVLHGETGGQRSPEVAQIAGDVTGSYRSYFQGFLNWTNRHNRTCDFPCNPKHSNCGVEGTGPDTQ